MSTPVVETGEQFRRQLTLGVAQLIAEAGIGVWSPTATYAPNVTAIYVFAQPEAPDRQIVLAPFTLTDQPDGSMSLDGLQLRTRAGANPFDVMDLDDALFRLLHGRTNYVLSTGVTIVQSLRRSSASLGQDSSRRWSWTSNYYLDVWHPAPHRH
jgi:hypothetical protein